MSSLIKMTEGEYMVSDIQYPQIVLLPDIGSEFIRWTAPEGFNIFDSRDGILICLDGDFLTII